ncbi:chloride channel protein [Bacillus sp. HC-Mk]
MFVSDQAFNFVGCCVGKLSDAPLNTLWLYLILGIIFGIFGPIFNKWVLGMQDLLR